jgi:hypothetical protein
MSQNIVCLNLYTRCLVLGANVFIKIEVTAATIFNKVLAYIIYKLPSHLIDWLIHGDWLMFDEEFPSDLKIILDTILSILDRVSSSMQL